MFFSPSYASTHFPVVESPLSSPIAILTSRMFLLARHLHGGFFGRVLVRPEAVRAGGAGKGCREARGICLGVWLLLAAFCRAAPWRGHLLSVLETTTPRPHPPATCLFPSVSSLLMFLLNPAKALKGVKSPVRHADLSTKGRLLIFTVSPVTLSTCQHSSHSKLWYLV